jgi:hypothetical protein
MDAIIRELNVGLCRRDIANHWACRCTVPGPGMRRAGEILKRRYEENGAAHAELIPCPADDRTEFLDGHKNPLEWRPQGSSLAIVQPSSAAGVICRYADEPLSLVCNSTATPPEGVLAEVVLRHGPLAESAVTEGEWAGKLLFTDQPPGSVEAAARQGGALGVISDCVCPPWLASYPPVREPEDAPDLVMWTVFSGRRDQKPLFGFNLSARQGRRLRQLLAQSAESVVLQAVVQAELVEGSSDFVQAVLPGTDLADEEIWVLAHLSEPGARDNASGCALSLELARTLTTLTSSGILPPLRRTLRFMHAVEVSGFLPYLDARLKGPKSGDFGYPKVLHFKGPKSGDFGYPKVLAGLCLDSVGQDFSVCGGELVLFQSPEQDPSFVDGLMEGLLNAAKAEPVARFSTDHYAPFPWHTEPFWGNDAFISDGFFDVPTPQLSTWPDRFYHSSQDTPDQMSDNTLGRVGAATGTYLYLLATAGTPEARWFGLLAAQDWKRRICQAVSDHLTTALTGGETVPAAPALTSLVQHLGLQGYDAVLQAGRFAPDDEELQAELCARAEEVLALAEREALQEARVLGGNVGATLSGCPASARTQTESSVPGKEWVARRLRWSAPPSESLSEFTRERLAELSQSAEGKVDLSRVWRWINGRRTAREIHQRLRHGGEIPLSVIVEYLRLLAEEGALELAM